MEAQLPVGLFFGSFNPIHNGHLAIARYLLDEQFCREIWFIVSPRNPWKEEADLLDENKRLEIVNLSIGNDSRMKGCDIEFSMPRPSFTFQTLRELRGQNPSDQFVLVIGGDNLQRFHLWRNYQEILDHHPLFVYPRKDMKICVVNSQNIKILDAPILRISSTEIRYCVDKKENIDWMVAESARSLVCQYYELNSGFIKM